MKRKSYSKALKSKVAVATIKGQKTVNEITSEFGVHVSQVNRWKKQVMDFIPEIFGTKKEKNRKDMEAERDNLFLQIGKLKVEVDWLKKTTGHLL